MMEPIVARKPIPRGLIRETQRSLIVNRKEAVERNPRLVVMDRWDLSKVFYDTRTILDRLGYDTSSMNKSDKRKAIHNDVAVICFELGVKRHEIGIFAADRAQMAFNGRTYNVTYETFKSLAKLGTDIIFTEKEGLVNTLVPLTTNMGIALVHSGGWSSEYAEFLIHEAHRIGFKNIGILTDFDSQGVGIAMEYPFVTRLGVDLTTVSDLGIERVEEVEEHIEPLKYNKKTGKLEENTHWVGLNAALQLNNSYEADPDKYLQFQEFYSPFLQGSLPYLRDHRIELGAITANVGPQRFWDWLKNIILDVFQNRDYNRALDVPEVVYPDEYVDLTKKVEAKLKSILKQSHEDWKNKLSNHNGFINNTKEKLNEIETDMYDNTLMVNDDVKAFIKDLNKLMKKDYLNEKLS
jgi:hypothetical protein